MELPRPSPQSQSVHPFIIEAQASAIPTFANRSLLAQTSSAFRKEDQKMRTSTRPEPKRSATPPLRLSYRADVQTLVPLQLQQAAHVVLHGILNQMRIIKRAFMRTMAIRRAHRFPRRQPTGHMMSSKRRSTKPITDQLFLRLSGHTTGSRPLRTKRKTPPCAITLTSAVR